MKQLEWKPTIVATLDELSDEQKSRIAARITGDYEKWRVQRMGYERVWRSIDNHLNQYDPYLTPLLKREQGITMDEPTIMGSKLKMSNVLYHREGIVAAIMKFLMANEYDFFDIVPLDPMEDPECQAVKEYMLYLFDIMDFQTQFTPFLRDLVTYGTGIAAYEWVQEKTIRWRTDKITDPVTGEESFMRYQAPETIYDAPKFKPINLYRAMIDPGATDIRTATLIFQKLITAHEIMANPAYGDIDEDYVFGVPDTSADQDSQAERYRETARGNENFSETNTYTGKKKVYEAWGDFTDGKILYQNYVAEVLDGRLIRFEPNPYQMPHKPFIIARYGIETDRVYGRSPLASITAIQAGFDTIVNQVIDSNAMHNERPLMLEYNALVQNKTDRKAMPPLGKNSVWKMRNITGLARMQDNSFRGVSDSLPIIQMLEHQMEQATGNSLLTSGGAQPNPYMKTGVFTQAADAGNARFNLDAISIENEAIVPMLEMTIDLLRQQATEPKTFKTNDGDLSSNPTVEFRPELLLNNLKFSMRGASFNATKQLQLQAMQNFLQLLASNPLTAPLMNWGRVIVVMGEALGIRQIRSLFLPQAMQMVNNTPAPQLPWIDNVKQLFGMKQQKEMQDDGTGQGIGNALGTAFGGPATGSGQQSPFGAGPLGGVSPAGNNFGQPPKGGSGKS